MKSFCICENRYLLHFYAEFLRLLGFGPAIPGNVTSSLHPFFHQDTEVLDVLVLLVD